MKKANLKQGSLFSFFQKSPPPKKRPASALSPEQVVQPKPNSGGNEVQQGLSSPLGKKNEGKKVLTQEQKDRIAENRRRALAKLNAKKNNGLARAQSEPVKSQKSKKPVGAPKPKQSVSDSPVKKRKRLKRKTIVDDDDDYMPSGDEPTDDNMSDYVVDEDEQSESDNYTPTPKKKKSTPKKRKAGSPLSTPKKSKSDMTSFSFNTPSPAKRVKASPSRTSPKPSAPPATSGAKKDEAGREIQSWLTPAGRRDKLRRRPGEEGFDPRTLYIPPAAYKSMSPGEAQYWRMKSENFDVVLFFKMGKFYELFDDDADIGAKELDLIYMKGKRRHVGFPEAAYTKYAKKLVHLGYKVGRVEQMETPEMLKERNKKIRGKKDKVVRRDLVNMLTKATLVDLDLIGANPQARFLLSVCDQTDEKSNKFEYGVTFVDASTGSFYVGQFTDDRTRTRFRTLIAQITPEEIVFPQGSLSEGTRTVLKNELRTGYLSNPLEPGREFWDAATTFDNLDRYFPDTSLPEALDLLKDQEKSLAFSALGGCVWYLTRLKLDEELMSMNKFTIYDPSNPRMVAKHLTLDAQTIQNLEILENSTGGKDGTLFEFLDCCRTAFGKRLLKRWICQPLARAQDINTRLDCIEDLIRCSALAESLSSLFRGLGDMERLLSRIHAMGIGKDKEAVMYTDVNTRKLNTFLKLLKNFQSCSEFFENLKDNLDQYSLQSEYLKSLLTVGEGMPSVSKLVKEFNTAFDHDEAKKQGFMIPHSGFEPEYDDALDTIDGLKQELDQYLAKVKRQIGDKKIKYVHKNKEKYQLEISKETAKRTKIPDEYQLMSSTTKVHRYWTDTTRRCAAALERACEKRDAVLRDLMRRVFARFASHNQVWTQVVAVVAELDCLLSLAGVSMMMGDMCRPEFVEGDEPCLEVRNAVHPCVVKADTTRSFIPNDTVIGCAENKPKFVLVSGPNMGGKSTLLRQTCVSVILAQIGCYVPAESCRLTPVDRIFTRVGASDRIMQGQSTFLVELEETANILRHASSRSLVILDELGRGTSTFDGTAIAYAVIQFLSQQTGCLSLFSTHYHMLMEEFANDPRISMYHMSCVVDKAKENVTFLYKFVQGTCPKSYGMNVARLAGLPEPLIKRAREMSEHFEKRLEVAHNADTELAIELKQSMLKQLYRAIAKQDVPAITKLQEQVKRQALL